MWKTLVALLHKFGFSEDRKTSYKKWGEETYFDAHYYKLNIGDRYEVQQNSHPEGRQALHRT